MKTHGQRALAVGTICFSIVAADCGRAQDALCTDGYASLDSKFATGVTVQVGPPQSGGFAQKICAASLMWEKQQLQVATDAAQIDVDLLGADLGLKTPVVAFQIRQSDADTVTSYRIYSLNKAPRLLRTITGASSFNAADVGLDGRVAIWTDDAGAWDGIEGLNVVSFAAMPMMVLRFEDGKLLDAGAEFQSYFDAEIARLRADFGPAALQEFKQSAEASENADRAGLAQIKAHVLGIVWLFLYSGREAEAWATLEQDWPPKDLERIRGEIRGRAGKGIRSQVDGVSTRVPNPGEIRKEQVFASVDEIPRGIRLKRSAGDDDPKAQESKEWLELVVDSAGKVRLASMVSPAIDDDLVAAAKNWKFIPAFRGGRPVASRFRMYVAPYR